MQNHNRRAPNHPCDAEPRCDHGLMSRPLKIMMLGLRGFPHVEGGVESHAENLCTRLVDLGCEVIVVVRTPYQSREIGDTWHKIRFKRIWSPRTRGLEALVHTFFGVLYAGIKRPDILHIHAVGPALMVPVARLLHLKVVVTHHGADYERKKWGRFARAVLRSGEFLGMHLSNARISISSSIRKLIEDKYGLPSELVPNGVNIQPMPQSTDCLEKFDLPAKRYVLFVGRFVPEKAILDLIHAFNAASLEGWKLVLVGSTTGTDEYTKLVLQEAAKNSEIVCTGFQKGNGLKELYANAGVFVLPSLHEGLPISLLEALSFGVPIIASDIPAHMGIDSDGISYFHCGDTKSLARKLQRHAFDLEDIPHRLSLREHIVQRYQWSEVAWKTRQIYLDVVDDSERDGVTDSNERDHELSGARISSRS